MEDKSNNARQRISDVLIRYATGIDRRDWALFRTCFTEDCDADYGELGHWRGADAIAAWMERAHRSRGLTLHRITNQVIDVQPETATARSYVDAIVMAADGKSANRAHGIYDDELILTQQGWKIARRRFALVLVQMDVPAGSLPKKRTQGS